MMVLHHQVDILSVGTLVLFYKAWYDVIHFLHTRERLRTYQNLIERGVDLINLAVSRR